MLSPPAHDDRWHVEFVAFHMDYETIGSESSRHRRLADSERAQVLVMRVEDIDRPIVISRILSTTLDPQIAVPGSRYPPYNRDFVVVRWSYFVGQFEGKVKVDSDWF